ncbi:MAG: hypothetical protein R3A12_00735 [Ignavibacteria bacterium]
MKKQIYILFVLILLAGCGSTGGSDSPANSIKDFDKALQEQNPGKAGIIFLRIAENVR